MAQLNEFKRMQQLAGLLKENTFTPENIKQYLLGMVEEFSAGNDNEYPVGKKMEFKYESIEKEDIDNYGEEEVNTFKKAKEFLVKNGPVTINNRIDYTFSTKGKDIVMNWVEPNWDQLNENLEQDILDFWGVQQDDAAQSDGEYEAKWENKFFIDQYPEYKGKEQEINSIVKKYKNGTIKRS
jgi:hypothetical protein